MPKLKNNLPNKYLINLANKLSEINQFETFPNPCVGAVGIDQNNHIHLAVTGKHGSPHAEFALLKNKKINFIFLNAEQNNLNVKKFLKTSL